MRIYILIATLLIVSIILFLKKEVPEENSKVEKTEKVVGVEYIEKETY